jgi:hypothetical protein
MKKEIKDGKVAVLYSPGFGAGWYSWHGVKELIFDPSVVYMVEQMNESQDVNTRDNWVANIVDYCKERYDVYTGGAEDLVVGWLEEGTEFMIDEYDGSESLLFKDEEPWMKA